METYTVIRDNREKAGHGWDFSCSTSSGCLGTIPGTLATGDYTLQGYEGVLTIERKGSVLEFAGNLTQSRFERELERLEGFAHPFIILEFDLADLIDFPARSNVPYHARYLSRLNGYFLLKRFVELQLKYKTKIIFAGSKGKDLASSIFKRVLEQSVNTQQSGQTAGPVRKAEEGTLPGRVPGRRKYTRRKNS